MNLTEPSILSELSECPSVNIKQIQQLPDYPVLRQVQNALWRIGDVHGAAVMVGAGFSRFAERAAETTLIPPLWNDFRDAMLLELYPNGGGTLDPLALAEEYRAALGPHALENLIRSRVRDSEWTPGELHAQLLRLPWADVLTTNWDTLLERAAASDADLSFDVVRVCSDIARTRAPRIVKLHGSLPSHPPYIFTEEDFRTYPRKFAPFVNLAQQVLLENELCLIGFSGDDPNFLEWAGWVRDQLGSQARPIRLIGVLELSPSRRRLLETRHITPIDLAPLVENVPREDKHRQAATLILDALWQARPQTKAEWKCASDSEYDLKNLPSAGARVARVTQLWRRDREAHPGWLVTPSAKRQSLRYAHEVTQVLRADLASASTEAQAAILYEAIWRWETGFDPLPDFVENPVAELVLSDGDVSLNLDKRVHLRAAIVRAARRKHDWAAFDARIGHLEALGNAAAAVEGIYERCLRARDQLDYAFLAANVSRITGQDPVWLLRRAALAADLADNRKATNLIREAYREIRKRRAQDRRSLWLLSREAWALWLRRAARFDDFRVPEEEAEWPHAYKAAEIDPWDELQHLDNYISRSERERLEAGVERRALFDAGRYRVFSREKYRTGGVVSSAYSELICLAEHAGIPIKLGMVNVLESQLTRAVELHQDDSDPSLWAALRAISSYDRGLIDKAFNRAAVARMPAETVSAISSRLRNAIAYGRTRLISIEHDGSTRHDTAWVSKLRIFIEILSRLSLRFRSDEALDVFRFGVSIASDPKVTHWWLFESIGHLLERSLQGLEPEKHHLVALEALRLQLPSEKVLTGRESDWPELSDEISRRAWTHRKPQQEWSSRIASLIRAVSENTDKLSRQRATIRLVNMSSASALSEEEGVAFGQALWAHHEPDGMPIDTNMLPHVFLRLPSPDPEVAEKAFYNTVVLKLVQGDFSGDRLLAIHGVSFLWSGKYQKYPLKESDALAIIDHVLSLESKDASKETSLGGFDDEQDAMLDALGGALANTILPALSAPALGAGRIRAILDCSYHKKMNSLLGALPALTVVDPSIVGDAVKAIQHGLFNRDSAVVVSALTAVNRFVRLAKDGTVTVPPLLSTDTVSLCVMRREPGLISALRCAHGLVMIGAVSGSDMLRLSSALDSLLTETDYDNWLDDKRPSDVGLIRRASVRLASALKTKGLAEPSLDTWLTGAASDPMPEVRYALDSEAEF